MVDPNPENYLASSKYINWEHPSIKSEASRLASLASSELDLVRASFEFVRDEIRHSWDYQLNPVTCVASEVLRYKTGYCYAKSHLLAALLRANGIAAGLCYQRLTISNQQPPFCLHGLNAVYLKNYGWYRIDPRGNKTSVNAEFSPPVEQLAFPTSIEGEIDLPEIWENPMDVIIEVLENSASFQDVANKLPDAPDAYLA